MVDSWRIVKKRHAANAFDGEGASLYGGRWNSPGVAMVYTADTPALAALEILVHLGGAPLEAYVLIACSFDQRLVPEIVVDRLPKRWRAAPAPAELQALGDQWVRHATSAVLKVPSAIIDSEFNFLLNPQHRDFAAITMAAARPFDFDPRLLR